MDRARRRPDARRRDRRGADLIRQRHRHPPRSGRDGRVDRSKLPRLPPGLVALGIVVACDGRRRVLRLYLDASALVDVCGRGARARRGVLRRSVESGFDGRSRRSRVDIRRDARQRWPRGHGHPFAPARRYADPRRVVEERWAERQCRRARRPCGRRQQRYAARQHRLRGADAIHLASAAVLGTPSVSGHARRGSEACFARGRARRRALESAHEDGLAGTDGSGGEQSTASTRRWPPSAATLPHVRDHQRRLARARRRGAARVRFVVRPQGITAALR